MLRSAVGAFPTAVTDTQAHALYNALISSCDSYLSSCCEFTHPHLAVVRHSLPCKNNSKLALLPPLVHNTAPVALPSVAAAVHC